MTWPFNAELGVSVQPQPNRVVCESNWMLLALLRQYVRPYRWLLTVVAVLQVISTLASLYLPTVNAAIIDDGVAKGDTETIVELGGVMLAVTGLQVLCAVGAVYFGSRAAMGFGRDLRSAIFHHVTGFSAAETARFGAPSLLTRTTNDVQQIQLLVQLTCTMLITAPIMSIGGIFMAVHQDAGLSWLLLVSVPVLAIANYWVVSHLLPIFRSMQRLIDGINRVMREQLSGIRVIRAFAREPFERNRFAEANQALSDTALTAGRWQALMLPVTTLVINISSVALIWFGGLRIDDGQMQVGSLIAFLSYFMQILMAVLLATFILILRAAGVGVRRTDHRGAVHRAGDHQPGQPRPPAGSRRCDQPARRHVQLSRRRSACAAGCFADRRARHHHRHRRIHRVGQVDAGVADLPDV